MWKENTGTFYNTCKPLHWSKGEIHPKCRNIFPNMSYSVYNNNGIYDLYYFISSPYENWWENWYGLGLFSNLKNGIRIAKFFSPAPIKEQLGRYIMHPKDENCRAICDLSSSFCQSHCKNVDLMDVEGGKKTPKKPRVCLCVCY